MKNKTQEKRKETQAFEKSFPIDFVKTTARKIYDGTKKRLDGIFSRSSDMLCEELESFAYSIKYYLASCEASSDRCCFYIDPTFFEVYLCFLDHSLVLHPLYKGCQGHHKDTYRGAYYIFALLGISCVSLHR